MLVRKTLFLSGLLAAALVVCLPAAGIDFPGITDSGTAAGRFPLIERGIPAAVITDAQDTKGVLLAATNLRADFERVCGTPAPAAEVPPPAAVPLQKKIVWGGYSISARRTAAVS